MMDKEEKKVLSEEEQKELEKYGEEQANNLKRDELLVGDPE